MALAPLFPVTTQFQARTGANLTAGYLRVYYTQTDDRAPTYSDFFGTENQDDIVLDNDGRAVVIVDDTKTYRLEVYTYNGACLFTIDPLSAVGGGGGSGLASVTKIISTDGTVQITTTTSAGTTYFDLSTALSPEASRWGTLFGARSVITGDGTWEEIPVITSIGTETYQNGWVVNKDTGYDIAASLEMVNGSSVATKLVEVRFDTEIDGNVVHTQYATIDPSRNIDKVSFEWKGDVTEGQIVNGRMFVSSTEALTLGLVSNVLFNEECDGVIGGAGSTYVAGQYIDIDQGVISVTGVQPSGNYLSSTDSALFLLTSQSGLFAPSGDYTYNSAFSSVQSGLLDLSSTVSGLTGTYIEQSASGMFQPSGNYVSSSDMSAYVEKSAFDDCCSAMSSHVSALENSASSLSSEITSLSSTVSSLTGQYVEQSSISAESSVWNSASAISSITADVTSLSSDVSAISGAVSGLTGQYVEISAISGQSSIWNSASAISSITGDTATISGEVSSLSSDLSALSGAVSGLTGQYVEKSSISAESSVWNSASAVSAKQDITGMSAYVPFSSVECTTASAVTSIGGSAIVGHEYTGVFPIVVDNTANTISIENTGLSVDETMTAYNSAGEIVIGVKSGLYAYDSALSSKLDTTAQVVTSIGVAAGALSSINNYGLSAGTANSAGTALYDSAGRTLTSMATNAQASSIAASYAASAVSSVSGNYYPMTSNPSGYLTTLPADLVYSADMSGYIPTSESANYQQTTAMTAYQPSGDYIYASALGTGEI